MSVCPATTLASQYAMQQGQQVVVLDALLDKKQDLHTTGAHFLRPIELEHDQKMLELESPWHGQNFSSSSQKKQSHGEDTCF